MAPHGTDKDPRLEGRKTMHESIALRSQRPLAAMLLPVALRTPNTPLLPSSLSRLEKGAMLLSTASRSSSWRRRRLCPTHVTGVSYPSEGSGFHPHVVWGKERSASAPCESDD